MSERITGKVEITRKKHAKSDKELAEKKRKEINSRLINRCGIDIVV